MNKDSKKLSDQEQRQKWKERKATQRTKQKLVKEKAVSKYDLNYGMKPTREQFMSFEEYEKIFPDATKKDWIKAKIDFDHELSLHRTTGLEEAKKETLTVLNLEPYNPKTKNDCLKFRMVYLAGKEGRGERFYNHEERCMYCKKWKATYERQNPFKPFNLLEGEFPTEPKEGENQQGWTDMTDQNDKDVLEGLGRKEK